VPCGSGRRASKKMDRPSAARELSAGAGTCDEAARAQKNETAAPRRAAARARTARITGRNRRRPRRSGSTRGASCSSR
jgi:hypothetical protein